MDLQWGRTRKKKMRHKNKNKGEDRLSSLPDGVIHLILKFLNDTKSAIRTSVLSKRWEFIWTTFPYLQFQCPEFEFPSRRASKASINLACHVLKHRNHEASVSYLKIVHLHPVLCDKFIDYAVSHNVRDLNVFLCKDHKAFKLSKFSSYSITKLVLRTKLEHVVSELDCWDLPALTDLHLWLFPTGDDKRFLSMRCLTCLPALRTLSLSLWDFHKADLYLCLPELTTLHLTMCILPRKIWNLRALKTLTLQQCDFPNNMSDMFAALVSLQNLEIHMMTIQDCYIRCPQLMNLKIKTRYLDAIEGKIVVFAPKLTNFTSVGIFPITFEDSELDNVYIKLRGWFDPMSMSERTLKEYYQQFLMGLGSAKILNLQLETIEALSSISDLLVSSPSPFYNLKYLKLPDGVEASLSSIVRSYLLGGSPTATSVSTLPQNIVPHAATASMTSRNVVIEDTLAAPTKFVDSKDIQKLCIDPVDVGVQEKLILQHSEVQANSAIPFGPPVEGTCNGEVSSFGGNAF